MKKLPMQSSVLGHARHLRAGDQNHQRHKCLGTESWRARLQGLAFSSIAGIYYERHGQGTRNVNEQTFKQL